MKKYGAPGTYNKPAEKQASVNGAIRLELPCCNQSNKEMIKDQPNKRTNGVANLPTASAVALVAYIAELNKATLSLCQRFSILYSATMLNPKKTILIALSDLILLDSCKTIKDTPLYGSHKGFSPICDNVLD